MKLLGSLIIQGVQRIVLQYSYVIYLFSALVITEIPGVEKLDQIYST
jgi:hypothetical protein